MARTRGTFDESDVRIRPGKGSRPRSKQRPTHKSQVTGTVVTKDRGRYGVCLNTDSSQWHLVTCVRARQLPRKSIIVGDQVGVVGDLSGTEGSLARIIKVHPRNTVLRRTADDDDPFERVVIANAQQLLIVSAAADPTPRPGFVERALVAAYSAGITPIIGITKQDLANPSAFLQRFSALDIPIIACGKTDPIAPVTAALANQTTALIGHSGVGKSTLVNRLVPDAERETSHVSAIGKGRHTSTQSVALPLPGGGLIIDTPGMRSFGLAHIDPTNVVSTFQDLAETAAQCPRRCRHLGPPADPECELDNLEGSSYQRALAIREILKTLYSTT